MVCSGVGTAMNYFDWICGKTSLIVISNSAAVLVVLHVAPECSFLNHCVKLDLAPL